MELSYQGLPQGFAVQNEPQPTHVGLPKGFTVQDAHAKPSAWIDAAKGFGGGLLQNLNGFLGDNGPLQVNENDPQSAQLHHPAAETMSELPGSQYEPQTGVGKYAETAGQLAPTLFGGEASIPARILGRMLLPAGVGTAAAHAAAGAGPVAEGAARIAGEIVGGVPSGLIGAARTGSRALTAAAAAHAERLPIEDQKLIAAYEALGGNLRPGQYNPSNFVRQGDAVLADSHFPKASGFKPNSSTYTPNGQQVDQFNMLVSNTFGENAPRVTPQVIVDAKARIGKVYEAVLGRNSVSTTQPLQDALAKVESNLADVASAMDSKDVTRLAATINKIKGQLSEGGITGAQYQTYRQRGGLLDELAGSTSPALQKGGSDLRDALDDAFVAQSKGGDGAALEQARQHYRALKTIEPLANKAATGAIPPGQLLGAVAGEYGSPANAGNLGTLGRVGNAYLKALANSGTSERATWRDILNSPVSKGVPTILNSAVGIPLNFATSRGVNRVINNPSMRAKMLADVLQYGPPQAPTNSAALANILGKTP